MQMLDSGLRDNSPFHVCVYACRKETYAEPKILGVITEPKITMKVLYEAMKVLDQLLYNVIFINAISITSASFHNTEFMFYALNQMSAYKFC